MGNLNSGFRSTNFFSGASVLVFFVTLLGDQLTKFAIVATLYRGESVPETGLLRLTHVINSGSAFGLFPNQTSLLILLSFVGIGAILVFYRSHSVRGHILQISFGLQLGGAVGNLIDRIRLGYVVDFIDVGAWPVFNLADSAILLGLCGLIWGMIINREDSGQSVVTTYGPCQPEDPSCNDDSSAHNDLEARNSD